METKNYKMEYDFHTHTIFSHGKGTIEDNVKSAIENGLAAIAITDHGPGHLTYGIKRSNIPVMRAEIARLRKIYPDIEIFLGVEANIISTGKNLDVTKKEFDDYDFVIAGYHYGVMNGYCMSNFFENHFPTSQNFSKKMMIKNTNMVIKALYENNIKILTHPGDKGQFDILEIAKVCEKTHTLMEISSRHNHLTVEEIKIASRTNVEFVISSDAHTPSNVGSFEGGLKKAIEASLDLERITNIEKVKV